ncbi:MAG: hypothetical protein KY432_03715 [Acidobacteria bacterium]|nr:hypothetical protein [Acidobacteriota bacterium]
MRSLITVLLLMVVSAGAHAQVQAGPTVGDPISVQLDLRPGERVELEPTETVELIEQTAEGVTVRGFRPGTHELRFVATDERGSRRTITGSVEISSVLGPDDDLEPAPLSPPVPLPPNRTAWAAIGVAMLGAVAVWLYLLCIPVPRKAVDSITVSAGEELMRTIERVRRMSPSDERFATLSDAARQFLARVDPRLGRELTSTELMERLGGHFPEWLISDVRDVLSEGDYAKFSPWGGRASRFDSIVREASDLAVLDKEARRT